MSAIDAVASILQDLNLGTVGVSIFKENLPDQPDTAMCVYDTGGGPPALTQGDNTDCPSWQIKSRALDAATAIANMKTAYNALHGLTETTLHGEHFKLVWSLQSNPVSLGEDLKSRMEVVMNFRAFFSGVTR